MIGKIFEGERSSKYKMRKNLGATEEIREGGFLMA